MYTVLAHERKVIALLAKVSSRCFHWFPAAMLVSLGRTPIWRPRTELYKFPWNISANNSRSVYHTDLRLGEVVYLLIFCNICNSKLLLLNGFEFIFWLRDSENRQLITNKRKFIQSFEPRKKIWAENTYMTCHCDWLKWFSTKRWNKEYRGHLGANNAISTTISTKEALSFRLEIFLYSFTSTSRVRYNWVVWLCFTEVKLLLLWREQFKHKSYSSTLAGRLKLYSN